MEEKVVEPLNLDGLIGNTKNRVVLASVELEGGWKTLPPGVLALERDSSVFNSRMPADVSHMGELPIGPVVPAALPALIARNYPHKTNHTCGMHVHMSFETLWHYAILMVPEYQETMIHYLTEWAKTQKEFKPNHHIWGRLKGESEYCRKGFWPDAQVTTKRKMFDHNAPGHRYTIIHYCGRFNTIECRVLPMMNRTSLAVDAVMQVINITNACIHELGKKYTSRTVVAGKIELPNGICYEETIEESL